MAERRKIALVYRYDENWIGGTYYIQNLINALATIEDSRKPVVCVIVSQKNRITELLAAISYPYLHVIDCNRRKNIVFRLLNKASSVLTGKRCFSWFRPGDFEGIECIFPSGEDERLYKIPREIQWIPDFQEHYLPEFFSEEEVTGRKKAHADIANTSKFLVFSSSTAQRDFNRFYPGSSCEQFVMRFAASNRVDRSATDVIGKYSIPDRFFICSNQFWAHKNHITVFRALSELRLSNPDIHVVFTGKQTDYRNSELFPTLMKLAAELGIQDAIHVLGFIDRQDQLELMRRAIAVIQPSLFEGWSTVLEDAKSLNIPIISSSLPVHLEQLADYPEFLLFDSNDDHELAECMRKYENKIFDFTYDYSKRIQEYGETFISMIEKVCEKEPL